MMPVEILAAVKSPSDSAVRTIRNYADRFGPERRPWKRLTPREAIRLDILKRNTERDLSDLDLAIAPYFWKPPEDYSSYGVDFQHSVWRVTRLADEIEKFVGAPPAEPKPWIREVKRGWVYFIRAGDYIKIGYASDVQSRIKTLDTGSAIELTLLHSEPGSMEDESAYHKRFTAVHAKGEWYRMEGELAEFIKALK